MPTTVYFATNRVVTNAADPLGGYQPAMTPPANPAYLTYGSAFVDGIDVATNAQGVVDTIDEVAQGAFPPGVAADLSRPGRNLLLFIHGFDNTFSDALTRAAFNREWLAASGVQGADTTVIAFSWPSRGQVFGIPVPQADYLFDSNMAEQSGLQLMFVLLQLAPILRRARASGCRVTLLAHSMGNLALQSGVESWFAHANPAEVLFDHAVLAAGDTTFDCFDQPNRARLSGLDQLAARISTYYSHDDDVLKVSQIVNHGAPRLGQDGPRNRSDDTAFPPAVFDVVDCSGYRYPGFNPLTSHQYYRRSPDVRAIIAAAM